ncbi:Thyroid transcription factor 1-associated protein 26-like protein [Larimichthys crocea]|nr:Thyroid transcription factor 1-associated protein 26-like protein [Larimichthys crocea]
MSNRMRKKMLKKTSYQKTKEEFESIQEKRRKKKEEYLKNKQQREEAVQKYKQKKMETFQMLSKKTKKGQPNLNLQMEYLLQKIQGPNK